MKFNLSKIMSRAWRTFRKLKNLPFGECLHRAWISAKAETVNAARIAAAKAEAAVFEQAETWSGWKALGFEVVHGAKALFQVSLIWGERGDGAEYKASFFSASQVARI